MKEHIVFYDGTCPLCNRAVRFLLRADRKGRLRYAPLQGETARSKLPKVRLSDLDTLVLLEADGELLIEGKGALRICWHLGGLFRLLGVLSFLPRFLFDWGYRFVARRRYSLFQGPLEPFPPSDRFLP